MGENDIAPNLAQAPEVLSSLRLLGVGQGRRVSARRPGHRTRRAATVDSEAVSSSEVSVPATFFDRARREAERYGEDPVIRQRIRSELSRGILKAGSKGKPRRQPAADDRPPAAGDAPAAPEGRPAEAAGDAPGMKVR